MPNPDSPLRNPDTGKPIEQTAQPGYYPGYSTLRQKKFWDAATRGLVENRVANTPPIRFFSADELPLITAIVNRILPQDDRLPAWRIPLVEMIDDRLFANRIHGYRYADMPSDQEAYRLGLQAIEETAQMLHTCGFTALDPLKQDFVLKSINEGKPLAAEHIWSRMSIHRFWELLVQDCVSAYYAHPWAWDEIGYGGPAYPRAYTRLENGLPEPWEKPEHRYEWAAPLDSASDVYDDGTESDSQSHHGQGGTH